MKRKTMVNVPVPDHPANWKELTFFSYDIWIELLKALSGHDIRTKVCILSKSFYVMCREILIRRFAVPRDKWTMSGLLWCLDINPKCRTLVFNGKRLRCLAGFAASKPSLMIQADLSNNTGYLFPSTRGENIGQFDLKDIGLIHHHSDSDLLYFAFPCEMKLRKILACRFVWMPFDNEIIVDTLQNTYTTSDIKKIKPTVSKKSNVNMDPIQKPSGGVIFKLGSNEKKLAVHITKNSQFRGYRQPRWMFSSKNNYLRMESTSKTSSVQLKIRIPDIPSVSLDIESFVSAVKFFGHKQFGDITCEVIQDVGLVLSSGKSWIYLKHEIARVRVFNGGSESESEIESAVYEFSH